MSADTILGHPKGLFLLFTTEMWERISYYGMRGIFVLYLSSAAAVGAFGWDHLSEVERQSNALQYLSIYAFLAYAAPILGGWFADNFWGQRKAILVGGIFMALGHFSLGLPHQYIAGLEQEFLITGISLLVIGTGLFKPNISTMVGDLYFEGDQRKDSAYTIFYIGINIGSIFGYLLIGGVGEKINYQYGFLIAGIGILIGVVMQLFLANRYLGDLGNEPSTKLAKAENDQIPKNVPLTHEEKDRLKVIVVIGFFTVLFWTGFQQAAGSMNLFAKYNTDLLVFGWEMPASWLQAVNPILIIFLAPIFATTWINMGSKEPNSPIKLGLGLVSLGLGFVCMVGAALQIGDSDTIKASILWLVAAYFFHTIGELCLSPIGLATITKLAPLKFTSFVIGLWLFFIGFSNFIAGQLGKLVGEQGAEVTFVGFAIAAIAAGAVLYLISNQLVNWMHGAEKNGNISEEEKLEEEMSVTSSHDGISEHH